MRDVLLQRNVVFHSGMPNRVLDANINVTMATGGCMAGVALDANAAYHGAELSGGGTNPLGPFCDVRFDSNVLVAPECAADFVELEADYTSMRKNILVSPAHSALFGLLPPDASNQLYVAPSDVAGTIVLQWPSPTEPGRRAVVVVFNFDRVDEVRVDLKKSGIPDGARYAIYDVENPLGTPVLTGRRAAADALISLPMGTADVMAPRGSKQPYATVPHSRIDFGCYIVEATSPRPYVARTLQGLAAALGAALLIAAVAGAGVVAVRRVNKPSPPAAQHWTMKKSIHDGQAQTTESLAYLKQTGWIGSEGASAPKMQVPSTWEREQFKKSDLTSSRGVYASDGASAASTATSGPRPQGSVGITHPKPKARKKHSRSKASGSSLGTKASTAGSGDSYSEYELSWTSTGTSASPLPSQASISTRVTSATYPSPQSVVSEWEAVTPEASPTSSLRRPDGIVDCVRARMRATSL